MPPTSPRRTALVAALGALLALLPALALRGFTVDDALITARYATHVARGLGYRFNAAGPVTDGVTPLGFPYVLAPFAATGPLAALRAAKGMGLGAWTIAAAVLAVAVDRCARAAPLAAPFAAAAPRTTPRLRFAALLLLSCSAPLAAWSVAGMETGLVIGLAALGVALPELGRGRAGAAAAGLAAGLRPELLPWALVVAATPGSGACPRLVRVALAGLPFAAVVAIRIALFGHVVPLAVHAKPADLGLGANYAVACFLLTGPLALVAPLAWTRASPRARGLVLAAFVHFAAVAAAGGDWMPLSRLVAPVLPTVILAAAHLAMVADPRATALRFALALAGEVFQLAKIGPSAARVGADRLQTIEEMRGPLASGRVIAALDVGWLGAATDATLVDLAGVTDPAVAALPGSHTSKAIGQGFLDARGVDTLVLLLKDGEALAEPWTRSRFSRAVEYRVAAIPVSGDPFVPIVVGSVPHLHYLVLRRGP